MINTVIFDIGNVLVDFAWDKAFIEYFGFDEDTCKKVSRATVLNEDWNLGDKGEIDDDKLLELFIENDPTVEKEIRQVFAHTEVLVKKRDYAHDWIKRLQSMGIKVYLLSNYPRAGFEKGILDGNLSFVDEVDGAVISYKEKLIKPDHEIFKLLFNRYDINPVSAIFVDDNGPNIEAAKELGLNTILFKSKEQVLSDFHQLGINI